MTDKIVVTIRELNSNLTQILKKVATFGVEIVVTKHGKPYVLLKNVATIEPKKEIVATKLKQDIQKVITIPNEEPKVITSQFCLSCLKSGFKRPAVGEFEVTFEDGERKVPLCEAHKKRLVSV